MAEKFKKIMNYFSLPWKIIIALGIVISLFVSLSTVDNRFAKSDELNKLEATVYKDRTNAFKLAEAQTIKTFQNFQMQQMVMNKALQLQILNIQKENLDKQYYSLKREMRKFPNDLEIKEEYNDVKQQRIILKEKIDKKILENNK